MPIEVLEQRIAPAGVTPPIPYLVVTTADSGPGSLRNFITEANVTGANNPGETFLIAFAKGLHGSIDLKSQLPEITASISIIGPANETISIDGHGAFRIFNVQSASTPIAVSISHLTLTHGSSQYGGAVLVNDETGTVKITSCTITENQAVGASGDTNGTGIGGGIDLQVGTLDVTTSTISGNVAVGGHGGAAGSTGGNGFGGGLYIATGATAVLTSSTVSGNIALGANGIAGAKGASGVPSSAGGVGGTGGNGGISQGGGIWSYGNLSIIKSTISGNAAKGGSGGKGGAGGKGGSGNAGGYGGAGGYSENGFGGGIYSTGILSINSSTISGNIAIGAPGGKGGAGGRAGAHSQAGAAGETQVATFGYGGGIHSATSSIDLIQATVAKNTADQGGGLFINNDTFTELDNSTIAFNTAHQAGQGGGVWLYLDSSGDPATAISTVIGQNTAGHKPVSQDLFVSNGYLTANYSLVQSFVTGAVNDANGTDIVNKNPLLYPLAANGGTMLTCLPSSVKIKSPLLGTGSNPDNLTKDQRGDSRLYQGTIDIGAVEVA